MLVLSGENLVRDRESLSAALAEEFTVKMMVFGKGNDIEEIVKMAEIRSQAFEDVRRLIWIVDLQVLTTEKLEKYKAEDNAVVVLNLDGQPVDFLKKDEVKLLSLERAFAVAETKV